MTRKVFMKKNVVTDTLVLMIPNAMLMVVPQLETHPKLFGVVLDKRPTRLVVLLDLRAYRFNFRLELDLVLLGH